MARASIRSLTGFGISKSKARVIWHLKPASGNRRKRKHGR